MFNIKVFLIFSYSSVFDKIRHRRQRFLSAGSPAAVWCVVVWSRFNLRVGIHSKIMKIKKKKTTHMNLWAEPQLVCTWKCFLNVHCQCDAVLTLSLFCTCASLRLLYCQTGPEDMEETAGPRCQSKAAARPVHVHAEFKVDDLSFTDLVFTQRMEIPDPDVSSAILIQYFTPSFPLSSHPCATASCRFPLRTFLCMNDCTLPFHLNGLLHITSTRIWVTIWCWGFFVCIFVFFHFYRCSHRGCCSLSFTGVAATTEWIPLLTWLSPEVDQPSAMTARNANALLLIFAHLLSSIKRI